MQQVAFKALYHPTMCFGNTITFRTRLATIVTIRQGFLVSVIPPLSVLSLAVSHTFLGLRHLQYKSIVGVMNLWIRIVCGICFVFVGYVDMFFQLICVDFVSCITCFRCCFCSHGLVGPTGALQSEMCSNIDARLTCVFGQVGCGWNKIVLMWTRTWDGDAT